LADASGTVEEHCEKAGVGRTSVYRWLQNERFVAWLRGEEKREIAGYAGPVLLRAKEIALGSEDENVAIKAIDVFMNHMPGRKGDDGTDTALRVVLESLMRPAPRTVVQVAVNAQPAQIASAGIGPGLSLEAEAMKVGVMSLTQTVGPQVVVQTREEIRAVPVEEPSAAVEAAMAELAEIETKPADPWGGVRRGKVEEFPLGGSEES
jgi:hypothetical protein